MDLEQYLDLLRRALPSILLCALLAGLGAYFVSLKLPPRYEAAAIVLLEESSPDKKPSQDAVLALQELGRSYAYLMVQPSILSKVLQDLRIDESSEALGKSVKAELVPNTLLISVRVFDTDGQRAASIANKVAGVFIAERQEHLARMRQRLVEEFARLDQMIQRLEASSVKNSPVLGAESALKSFLQEYKDTRNVIAEELMKARIGGALSLNELRLVESARAPTAPSGPRPILNAIVAAIGGATLGFFSSILVWGRRRRGPAEASLE